MSLYFKTVAAVLALAALPCAALAANLPGYSCSVIGTTQISDDKASLIACLQTSATDATLIWKSMTPVNMDTANNIGIGTSSPTQKLDVNGHIAMGNITDPGERYFLLSTGGARTGIGPTTHAVFGPYDNPSGSPGAFYIGAGRKGSDYSRNNIILYNLSCTPDTKSGTDYNCNVPMILLQADETFAGGKLTTAGNIKIGMDGTVCNGDAKGSMRYNWNSNIMEYCNGTDWGTFGGKECPAAGAGGPIYDVNNPGASVVFPNSPIALPQSPDKTVRQGQISAAFSTATFGYFQCQDGKWMYLGADQLGSGGSGMWDPGGPGGAQ